MKKLLIFALLCLPFMGHQQTNAAQLTEKQQGSDIPMLVSLSQTAPNQLQITYDQPVDQTKGMNPNNYWIQSTSEVAPSGIATLGKNDSVNSSNALTADKVTIQPKDNSGQSFVMTFKQNIKSGMAFKLIICFITKPGAPPYSGDNGSATFVGR